MKCFNMFTFLIFIILYFNEKHLGGTDNTASLGRQAVNGIGWRIGDRGRKLG